MKLFKKLSLLMLAMVLVIGLAACGGKEEGKESKEEGKESAETSQVESTETSEAEESTASGESSQEEASQSEAESIVYGPDSFYLITDLGTIDDKSFNQGSFEGLKKFADTLGLEAKYLRPAGEGDQNYVQAIEQAIDAGAKIIVTPGFLFETAIGQVQEQHPDVKFIAVDFVPSKDGQPFVADNTVSILYHEEQSGFLAGYAAVKDGYTKLGFMGGIAVPAVVRYGFGFIAGANYAAEEMGIEIDLKYNYTGSFVENPDIQTMASSWYQSGTEVIFSCGGGIAASVLKAAQDNKGQMIGVDVDQKEMGEQVITSAMKNLENSVYEAVKSAVTGEFRGGEILVLGAKDNGVQISTDFSRFKAFTEEDYKSIFQKIVDNVDGLTDAMPQIDENLDEVERTNPETLMEKYPKVKLEYIVQ